MAQSEQKAETAVEEDVLDEVTFWRYTELARAGFQADDALKLALRCDVDLHRALDLVGKGCPQRLALKILL